MSTTHHIYWWNLENLFDIEKSTKRTSKLKRIVKTELKGWSAAVLEKKLKQLVSVISKFNSNAGPDIMGMCELENADVVNKLVAKLNAKTGRNYLIRHHDTQDERGIDVAFIYDGSKYKIEGELYSLEIMKRTATRDIVQIQLMTKPGKNKLVLLGNHWPARSAGQYESEPYRMMVGENLSYFVKRIHEEIYKERDNVSIVVMGDFNDEPYNRSLCEYAMSTHILKQVENSRTTNYLYNLMAGMIDGKQGTYVFGSNIHMLDQFLVSEDIAVQKSVSKFSVQSAAIIKYPELVQGEYDAPVKFGRPSSEYNPAGYSDHLPIELILHEA